MDELLAYSGRWEKLHRNELPRNKVEYLELLQKYCDDEQACQYLIEFWCMKEAIEDTLDALADVIHKRKESGLRS